MSAFLIALILVVVSFRLQEHIGLNMADEGFLWNGTNRTSSGLVPIRDFKSYDPGRFYWTSFFTRVFGKGIKGVRLSVAVFQFLGLWAGLDASTRLNQSWWVTALIGVLMLWWMQPRHKRFEHALTLIAIWAAIQLFENSTVSFIYFGVGCFVGVAAFMGRNHGVYAFLSFLSFFLILNIGSDLQAVVERGLYFVSGIIFGYSPMLLMWVFVPGLFRKYVSDKVVRILAGRMLKYAKLEFPWPWRVQNRLRPNLPPFPLTLLFLSWKDLFVGCCK